MVKSTKNKIRIIISIVAAVVLMTLLIANSAAFSNISVSSNIGISPRTLGSLTTETQFQQYFVPAQAELSYIEVRFATYTDETAEGTIQFELLNSDGKVISSKSVPMKDLQDDAYYRFNTSVKLDTSKTYSYTLRAVDLGWEKAPVVWVSSPSGQEQTSLVLPGVPTDTAYQANAQYGYSYFNTGAFIGCAFLILLSGALLLIDVELSVKQRNIAGWIVMILTPVAMFFLVEALNDNSALDKRMQVYSLNYAYYIILYVICFVLINRLRVSMLVSNSIIYVLAVINYFKLMFRGEPLQPWDIFSVKTAMNVASSYSLSLTVVLISSFLFFALLNIISWKVNCSLTRVRSRILLGAASTVLAAFMVFSLFGTDRYAVAAFNFMQKIGITNNVWNQTSNYEQNGLVIAFTMNAQYMNVDKPDSYSEKTVADIKSGIESGGTSQSAEAVPTTSAGTVPTAVPTAAPASNGVQPQANVSPTPAAVPVTQDTVSKPNIIAIMCESYANLQTIADYTTNKEVTPFYDAASDNVIKGSLYVSTYGGGTANTEFEFLTGNSMAFLPKGSIPYQQYIDAPTGSLARILKTNGYSTVAVHPYLASGWNRTSVYSNLGFDSFLSMDDFTNPSYMRGYISDECSYNKLIDLYESKPAGQPIFLFNVTMQNHGGYANQYENFTEDVNLTEYPGEFPETEQYLSLINKSDEALKNLIDYFSTVDEPTVICFFGDHLPNMKNNFFETILGENLTDLTPEEMLNLYQTPFLIWANYDINEQEIDKISANYLSTLLLQTANIPLPDYNQYLSTLYQSFPVIDALAVIDSKGNMYQSIDSVPGNEGIKAYSILAYNNLFDKSGRDATLFDSVSPAATGEGVMITGLPLSDSSADTGLEGTGEADISTGESSYAATEITPVS